MAYAAHIAHKTPGRIRLQMDAPSMTSQELRETLVQLQTLVGKPKLRANALTRTIVLEGMDDAKIQDVLDQAQSTGVLTVREKAPPSEPRSIPELLHAFRVGSDRYLKEVSDGRLDFKSGVALTMAGLGLRQSLRGKFLPAGLTMVFYALGMLEIDKIDPTLVSES